ncbi:alpha/beta hydrolase [Kitasatospora sp. NPDC096147]|uniref:alpha/beta hydrolase n=1 Tax=Kitasatospora sp. NPDC096147 TaxID=3364093 RepID=UPI003825D713
MPSLTGTPIQIVAVVLAATAFALTMWLWPRLAGKNWKAWTGRIGAFLVAQVAMLAAMGLVANSYFGFYTSWTDLLGTNDSPGKVVDQQPGKGSLSLRWEEKVFSSQGSARERSGVLQQVSLTGAKSGIFSDATVYLPPQYFQPAYQHQKFPMLLVLSGYPGSIEKLVTLLNYPSSTLEAIDEGKLPPTVLVMMRPAVTGNRDTECVDVPRGPQVETFFTEDVPAAVSAAYRVSDQPEQRAAIGNSTGGYCALKFALRKPDSYRTAISLSGYYTTAIDVTTGDLFEGDEQLKKENDLLWLLKNRPAQPVSLLLATSYNEYNYQATQEMVGAFRSPTKLSTITLDSGGHNFHTWTREIPPALEWLGKQLQQVRPA